MREQIWGKGTGERACVAASSRRGLRLRLSVTETTTVGQGHVGLRVGLGAAEQGLAAGGAAEAAAIPTGENQIRFVGFPLVIAEVAFRFVGFTCCHLAILFPSGAAGGANIPRFEAPTRLGGGPS